MPIDQVHADASMSVSNKLQTATTTTAIVDAAIDVLETVGYIVDAIQTDATYDPGVSPATDSKILITDSTALHVNIGSPVGLADDDIIKYSGSVYEVYFDASLRGSGASAYDRTTAERYTYNGTAWVESDTISDHADLQNIGTKSHATLDTEVGANTTHLSSDGSDHTFIDQDVTSGSSPVLAGTNFTGVELSANKNATGGYVGLSLFKIMFKNVADTFTSFFTNSNTAARTYTFQDRDGTIADDTDLALKSPLANPTFTGTVVAPAIDGSVSSAGTLTLQGTGHATPGNIELNPSGGLVGIGGTPAHSGLDITRGGSTQTALFDSSAVAINIGGGQAFGGNYTGTTKTLWAHIKGLKEVATDGNFAGYLSLQTRPNGGAMTERINIASDGKVNIKSSDLTIDAGNIICTAGGISPTSYTTGTLPTASTNSGVVLFDSTLTKLVRSNGTTYDTM